MEYWLAVIRRGTVYADKGDEDRAIADYTHVIELVPTHITAYSERARSYFKTGKAQEGQADAQKAMELAQKSLALHPTSASAHDIRGLVFEVLGKRDDAIADYRKALQLDPGNESSREGLKRLGAAP